MISITIVIIIITIIVAGSKIILRNTIVPLQALNPLIFRVKHCFNLVKSNHIRAKIMDQYNHLNYKPPLKVVTGKALLLTGKSCLQSPHPPLAGLTQRRMNITDP